MGMVDLDASSRRLGSWSGLSSMDNPRPDPAAFFPRDEGAKLMLAASRELSSGPAEYAITPWPYVRGSLDRAFRRVRAWRHRANGRRLEPDSRHVAGDPRPEGLSGSGAHPRRGSQRRAACRAEQGAGRSKAPHRAPHVIAHSAY